MTVGQLLAAASSRELSEWEAFYFLENEASEVDPETVLAQRAQAKLAAKKRKR